MSQTLASTAARAARTATAAGTPGAKPGAPRAVRPSPRRPPLRVVHAPPTAGSPLGFAIICAALLGTGLIALLLLNTAVAQDSFGLQRLQANARQLADQKQALIQSNDLAAAPAQLSAKAWSLGLVPSSGTAFIELPSGKVMGVANPAPAANPPTVITSTTRNNGTSSGTTSPTAGSASTSTVTSPGTAPGTAPAGPINPTAQTGTGPAMAPAPPKAAAGQTTQTSTKAKKTGHQPATPPTTTR